MKSFQKNGKKYTAHRNGEDILQKQSFALLPEIIIKQSVKRLKFWILDVEQVLTPGIWQEKDLMCMRLMAQKVQWMRQKNIWKQMGIRMFILQ